MDNMQFPGTDLQLVTPNGSNNGGGNSSGRMLALVSPASGTDSFLDNLNSPVDDSYTQSRAVFGDETATHYLDFETDPGEFIALWGFDFDPASTYAGSGASLINGPLFYMSSVYAGNPTVLSIRGYVIHGQLLIDLAFNKSDGTVVTATIVPDVSAYGSNTLYSANRYDMGVWWKNDGQRIYIKPFIQMANSGGSVVSLKWGFTRSANASDGVGDIVLPGSQFLPATNGLNSLGCAQHGGNYHGSTIMGFGDVSNPPLAMYSRYLGMCVKRNDSVPLDKIANVFRYKYPD